MPDDKQLQTVLSELSDQGRTAPVQQPATEIAPTSVKRSVKFENEELMLWRPGSKQFIREQSDTKLQLSGEAAYLIQTWYRKLVRAREPPSCGQVCEPGVNVCSIEELAEDTYPFCLKGEGGTRLTVDGLAKSIACGDAFDAGPLWQLVDEQVKVASEDMEEIGELGIIELHHDIVLNVATKMLEDKCPMSKPINVSLLSNLTAKLMVALWMRHGLGKLPRTEETYQFVTGSLAEDVVEAVRDIAAQFR